MNVGGAAVGMVLAAALTAVAGQLDQRAFVAIPNDVPIEYSTRPVSDPVATLMRSLEAGAVRLEWQAAGGYLPGVLRALDVPLDSQMVTFAKNSLQSSRITLQNPRAIFFNDSVAVGWVPGGFIELAAVDPQQGVIFYTLSPSRVAGAPAFVRESRCLQCHVSYSTLTVPGMLAKSVLPSPDGTAMFQFGSYIPDHRTPFEHRWGGWYVSGGNDALRHLGNAVLAEPVQAPSAEASAPPVRPQHPQLDPSAYPSSSSDIVPLMVFDHQRYMTNLLIRVGWEFRVAAHERLRGARGAVTGETAANLRGMANELVDYLLFVDEARLPAPVRGASGFAQRFSAAGPRDRQGRSLRQLDLQSRLLRYPCSYMIYSAAFDGLPPEAKAAIYSRMWEILSGKDRSRPYTSLSLSDRRAIVEILRDTKRELPEYFQQEVQS